MHAINEDTPAGPGLFEVTRAGVHGTAGRSFITNVRRLAGTERTPGSLVIMAMTWLLGVLGAGWLYVSFAAQYRFVFTVKGQRVPSAIEAGMLDVGMVLLSGLGIGLALAGKPSKSVRFLIMVCAAASAGMNFADADPGSWKSVAAYVAVPVFLAVITDRVIAVIRQHVLPLDAESAWAPLGRGAVAVLRLAAVVALYLLRAVLAPSSTFRGLRQLVLDAAPVPGMTGVRQVGGEPLCNGCPGKSGDQGADLPAIEFPTKKAALLSRYRGQPQYGNRSASGRIAAELAPLAGLQAGTGRTYIAEELCKLTDLAARGPTGENDDQPTA